VGEHRGHAREEGHGHERHRFAEERARPGPDERPAQQEERQDADPGEREVAVVLRVERVERLAAGAAGHVRQAVAPQVGSNGDG